ncbi:retrovirus-related pol polyprotein from transposon TNT 1-94 [Tanacetum coccineum]
MTKVIKEEFGKLESLKIDDDSFACNTSVEIFHKEFNRMSRMDDDLFTCEVEISRLANIPCDLNEEDDLEQQMTHGSSDDMEYDPFNARGDDKVELTDKESSDSDDEDEVTKIFKIDTNVFDFETPICRAFKDGYENAIYYHEERENEEEHGNDERCELFDNPHQEASVYNIKRFEMIKYSFGEDEEYVAIKEYEYDDLTYTNEDACRTYQEIFHRMDEGWMDLAGKEVAKVVEVSIIWNPMSGQRKTKNQWTRDERKAADLDQRLKSFIMSVLLDDQMNSDFQDSPDDKEDTRSSHEYLNDLEEEYQERALLAKSKRFFKKGTQSSPQHKPELRPTKDFKAKYNKVKAKLALLSSSGSASKASMMVEVKVLMALAEENDAISQEDARNGEWVKISMRKVHTLLEIKDNDDWKVCLDYLCTDLNYDEEQKSNLLILPADSQRNTTDPLVDVTDSLKTIYDSSDESSVCSNPLPLLKKLDGVEPISRPKTIKSILRSKSTFKDEALKGVIINDPSLTPAKGNKSSLASKVHSAPAGKLKSVKIEDDPPLAIVMKELNNLKLQCDIRKPIWCEKNDHRTCDYAEYISTMNMSQHRKSLGRASSRFKIPRPSKRFFPPCTHFGCIDHLSNECLYYPIYGLCGSYDHDINSHNRIISLEREINLRNPQHTTTDHYDIEWFKRGEALQAKKAEALKSTRGESSNSNRYKTPTKRHMTGVKSYLHKYVEQSRPKVVFRDDSTCTTEGYGSIKCNGIMFTKVAFVNGLKYNLISISQLCDARYIVQFDKKRGTIFNSNKEVVMIAPRVRDIYVLDMTSSAQESCFFAKASENLNWLWHKRLAHLNFNIINKLEK